MWRGTPSIRDWIIMWEMMQRGLLHRLGPYERQKNQLLGLNPCRWLHWLTYQKMEKTFLLNNMLVSSVVKLLCRMTLVVKLMWAGFLLSYIQYLWGVCQWAHYPSGPWCLSKEAGEQQRNMDEHWGKAILISTFLPRLAIFYLQNFRHLEFWSSWSWECTGQQHQTQNG